MDISKNVIARELLAKTADLKLLGLEISKQGKGGYEACDTRGGWPSHRFQARYVWPTWPSMEPPRDLLERTLYPEAFQSLANIWRGGLAPRVRKNPCKE
jgi:hypothetical protein